MRDVPILFSSPMVRALLAGSKTETRRGIRKARVFATPERPALTLSGVDLARALQGAAAFRRHDGNCWSWVADAFDWQAPADTTLWAARIGYAPGDRLWVREAWRVGKSYDETAPRDLVPRICSTLYEAGGSMGGVSVPPKDGPRPAREYVMADEPLAGQMPAWAGRLRASMHMPRWASRITLIVENVAIERLQDITHAGALAEGVEMESADPPFYYVPGIWPHSLTAIGVENGRDHAKRSYLRLWDHINGAGAAAKDPWVTVTRFRVIKRNIDNVE